MEEPEGGLASSWAGSSNPTWPTPTLLVLIERMDGDGLSVGVALRKRQTLSARNPAKGTLSIR